MKNLTISFPEELKEKMEQFPEINWSGLLRKYAEAKISRLIWKQEMLKKLDSEREFDTEALKIGDKIKQDMWEKYKQEGW